MRRAIVVPLCVLFALLVPRVAANGVGVVDASQGTYVELTGSFVRVSVENQVAVVLVRSVFRNPYFDSVRLKYAFPMPEGASATGLRWQTDGQWHEAVFAAAPQDTTLPGTGPGIIPALLDYLGPTPLFFDIDEDLPPSALLIVELTYVQLLPYAFGNVDFVFPSAYEGIQTTPLDEQTLVFDLTSLRTIQQVELLSHAADEQANDGRTASIRYTEFGQPADRDYHVRYTLNPEELGLFGFSTFRPDSLAVDAFGRGFFLFVAEPDPGETNEAIDKVFTLIVDRSGSMSGNKIVQARNAARFIVQNLNEGDRFNVIDFNDFVTSFRPGHVPFTTQNRDAALTYINGLRADGLTNISGAFSTAIPQFAAANDSTANLVVFFTDGRPTTGIVDPEEIVQHVAELVASSETRLSIFTFGVGPDVNQQLLTRLATENDGLVEFLGDDELEARITRFYEKIRNPVLLNTQMAFSVPVVVETYPDPLPDLYKGQQMIVSGRYDEATSLGVTLSGEAFGQPVAFTFDLALADTNDTGLQFLPKIWAKLKIEHLYLRYLAFDAASADARALREMIVQTSISYGVISPFTSFTGRTDDPAADGSDDDQQTAVEDEADLPQPVFELLGNYPNPFHERTLIRFRLDDARPQIATIKIYDAMGRLVRVLAVRVAGPGLYEVEWDGRTASGAGAPSGTYFYLVSLDDAVLGGKMMLVR